MSAGPLSVLIVDDEQPARERLQRLDLAYGGRGSLTVEQQPDSYRVTVRFPYTE